MFIIIQLKDCAYVARTSTPVDWKVGGYRGHRLYLTWTLTKRLKKKLDGNYTRMLRELLNRFWRQHPHKAPAIWPPTTHHENYPN